MNICIFGDSITWGADDFDGGGWPLHLWRYMYAKDGSKVYNIGISGEITTDTIKRFDVEAAAREASVIIFALGVNDSAYLKSKGGRWTPIEEFKQNLSLLHEKAKKFTDKIFFIGLTPVDEKKVMPAPWAPDYFYDAKTAGEYNEAIRAFCTERDIPFISMEGALTLADLPDGLHPNTEGHKKMFEKIRGELDSRRSLSRVSPRDGNDTE